MQQILSVRVLGFFGLLSFGSLAEFAGSFFSFPFSFFVCWLSLVFLQVLEVR